MRTINVQGNKLKVPANCPLTNNQLRMVANGMNALLTGKRPSKAFQKFLNWAIRQPAVLSRMPTGKVQ
jgi:hypothetical protein